MLGNTCDSDDLNNYQENVKWRHNGELHLHMQGMGSIVQMRAVASCMFSSGAPKVIRISMQHIGGLGEWFPL